MSNSKINFVLVVMLIFFVEVPSLGQTVPIGNDEQINSLITVLKSDASHKEKADACRQLAVIGTKDVVEPLAAFLYDEELSHMARYGLEPIPESAVDEVFRTALSRLKGKPLVGVIGSIGVRRDVEAVADLTKLLQDADLEVAQAAAKALGKIGNWMASSALLSALDDAPAANLLAFCEGLLRCAEVLAANNQRDKAIAIYDRLLSLQEPYQISSAALRGAILISPRNRGLELLEEYLRSDDYVMFSTAVKAAQELHGTKVTQTLISVLNQLPPDNQILVIQALGKRSDKKEASRPLFALAKTGEKSVRLAAIRTLGELGLASAVPVLVQLLDDADPEISMTARESLAALPGKEADTAVMAMLNSKQTSRQLIAVDLAGRRRMKACIPDLLRIAKDPEQKVRPEALKQLGELGGPKQLPALIELLMNLEKQQDLDAAEWSLINICARADDPESYIDEFTEELTNVQPAQKSALLRIISSIRGDTALEVVSAALDDPNAKVRATAIRSLGEWDTNDAAVFLLETAQNTSDPNEKILSLRSYLNLTAKSDLSIEQRLSACKQAAKLIERKEEKKQLLAVLSGIDSPDALTQIIPFLNDPATQEEAGTAYVAISERLMKGQDSPKLEPELIKHLEKIEKVTENADLIQRAKVLLEQSEIGFAPIFNGKDLTGWTGDEKFWSVQDGEIIGQSTSENVLKKNTFLIWQGDKPEDFELRLSFHIEKGNSGIQIRSKRLHDWVVIGYQADCDSEMIWTGGLYEEKSGRGVLCKRGQEVVIDENGKREVTVFKPSAELLQHIKAGDWNDCHIIADGSEITLKVNGVVMSKLVDKEKDKAARSGIIALQLHAGEPMKVRFKDIRLKEACSQ